MRRLSPPVVTALAPLVVGTAVGVLWAWLAPHWYWTVTAGGFAMGEHESLGQFRSVGIFVALGAAASVVWGVGATWAWRAAWVVVPIMVISSLAAALLAWQVGVRAGPADPATKGDAARGTRVPAQLVIDSPAPFLAWPVGAIAGVLAATVVVKTRR